MSKQRTAGRMLAAALALVTLGALASCSEPALKPPTSQEKAAEPEPSKPDPGSVARHQMQVETEAKAREEAALRQAQDEAEKQRKAAADDAARRAAEEQSRIAAERVRRDEEAKTATRAPAPASPGAPDPVGGAAPEPEPSTRGLGTGRTRSFEAPRDLSGGAPAAQPPAAPAAPPSATPPPPVATVPIVEPWTVVPIFYGTDRARADTDKRIGYDWQRGRRLELGQALVTVPKKHEVPMVERPWALRVPILNVTIWEAAEDPSRHFTLKELKALPREDFLALVRAQVAKSDRFKEHALVFVHGYQTTFDNAVFRTAQIAYDMKFDSAPFLYSWPSGGTLLGYIYDRESAGQAERYLQEFLDLVVKETGAKRISVIAHSMGNQPLLRVLQDLRRALPEGAVLSQLILAAPDVDRDNFENIVGSIAGIAEGITLYAAANDQALLVSRQVNGGIPRAGDVPPEGPIVMPGVDTIDATITSMDSLGINHSGYAENNALLEDIKALIGTGTRPPEKRIDLRPADTKLPVLETVTSAKGQYWRYVAKPSP